MGDGGQGEQPGQLCLASKIGAGFFTVHPTNRAVNNRGDGLPSRVRLDCGVSPPNVNQPLAHRLLPHIAHRAAFMVGSETLNHDGWTRQSPPQLDWTHAP
jgi:hypothetical protein